MKKWTLFSLVLLIAGFITYHLVIAPKVKPKEVILLETVKPECTPVEFPCEARNHQQVVTLHFPNNVKYLKPFQMQVTVQGFKPREVEKILVDFKMIGMDMGLNRYTLSPVTNEGRAVSYQGEAILPVCVSGRVDWVANIQLMTADKLYESEFAFKVSK
jgi:hypothetical protein